VKGGRFKLGKSEALAWIVWVCKVSQGTLERLPDKRDNDHIDECWQGMSDTGRGRPLQRPNSVVVQNCSGFGHEAVFRE